MGGGGFAAVVEYPDDLRVPLLVMLAGCGDAGKRTATIERRMKPAAAASFAPLEE